MALLAAILGVLADHPLLTRRSVGNRILADPALIDRLGGQLIARIAGNTNAVGVVIQATMYQENREDQLIRNNPAAKHCHTIAAKGTYACLPCVGSILRCGSAGTSRI